LESADAIGSLHPGEQAALSAALPARAWRIRPLDVALTLNRSATEHGLFGVSWFGEYVLLIRRFPASAPRFDRAVTHELLRAVLGDIAIAEVDGAKWRVTDFVNTASLPVNPTRVNLWYRTPGEVLDLASTLIDDDALLSGLRSDGLRYSVAHHEQMAAFVARTNALVLG
jgi:hypothetical protein